MPHLFRLAAVVAFIAVPAVAFAQATVRVSVERANIWRPGFMSVVTVVESGTELEVVGRQGDWLEVVVPTGSSGDAGTGLIGLRQVTVLTGALPAESAPTAPARPRVLQGAAAPAAPRPALPPDTGFRAFGDVSYNWFTARESFRAILDQPGGVFVGGGAEYRAPGGLFVQGAARWFRRTGERAFVLDGEVFPLGIADTITIVPLSFTAGYRFPAQSAVPYVGGGAGRLLFKETSEFADLSEEVDERFLSYHVLAGVEWRSRSAVAAAFEVQYTLVPDSLTGPLADAFDEHDLGGLEARFKIVFGR
jgi:opacity protein-like surface antigen